jgi:hypothetical protein
MFGTVKAKKMEKIGIGNWLIDNYSEFSVASVASVLPRQYPMSEFIGAMYRTLRGLK